MLLKHDAGQLDGTAVPPRAFRTVDSRGNQAGLNLSVQRGSMHGAGKLLGCFLKAMAGARQVWESKQAFGLESSHWTTYLDFLGFRLSLCCAS